MNVKTKPENTAQGTSTVPPTQYELNKGQQSHSEFSGDLVVRILGSHCHGPHSVPDLGAEILQAVWCGQR